MNRFQKIATLFFRLVGAVCLLFVINAIVDFLLLKLLYTLLGPEYALFVRSYGGSYLLICIGLLLLSKPLGKLWGYGLDD